MAGNFDSAQLQKYGFAIVKKAVSSQLCNELSVEFESILHQSVSSGAGVRNLFQQSAAVCQLVRAESIRKLIEPVLGESAFAVRAILFDKSLDANWYVTWHQDTFIAVEQQCKVAGYEAWSVKDGIPHVRPPVEVLENMVSLRLHLDACQLDNGPLRVIPTSHQHGICTAEEVAEIVDAQEEEVCEVEQGDVVLMSPLLVHASSRVENPTRRRILHIEFANCKLAAPLEWYEQH